MAGGEESFATGSPASQITQRDTASESSVDQGTEALLAGACNQPETPAAVIPGTVAFAFEKPTAAMTGTTTTTTTTGSSATTPKFGGNYPGSSTAVWVGGHH